MSALVGGWSHRNRRMFAKFVSVLRHNLYGRDLTFQRPTRRDVTTLPKPTNPHVAYPSAVHLVPELLVIAL